MTEVKDNKIEQACSILFGDQFSVEQATIDYLQLSGIKHAFREKVKECHPDTSGGNTPDSSENFIKLKDAYDFLVSVKSENAITPDRQKSRSKNSVIPNRKLRLGEYLYYSGKISWKDLISAITWQRQNINKQRCFLFGLYFIKHGVLSSTELGFSIFKLNVHNANY